MGIEAEGIRVYNTHLDGVTGLEELKPKIINAAMHASIKIRFK
jgi:hypothetical protein